MRNKNEEWKVNLVKRLANVFAAASLAVASCSAEAVFNSSENTLVVDFGQNCSAVPAFTVDGTAGTELEFRPADMLNEANGEKTHGNDGPTGTPGTTALIREPGATMTSECRPGRYEVVVPAVRGPEAWLELLGGNVRKDGLRCDLEAIKAAGIAGVQLFHIGGRGEDGIDRSGIWPGCEEQIPCMSEKWGDVVSFIGDECNRLGLRLTVQNCPGWSQSGGPWIDLNSCQRDLRCARLDVDGGMAAKLPEIPAEYRDHDSDWRDIAVLAFPTPLGDSPDGGELHPVAVETNDAGRIYRFAGPTTVRTVVLPGIVRFNHEYCYRANWLRATLEAKTPDGWRVVLRTPLPASSWRDSVETLSLACDEETSNIWRFRLENDFPIVGMVEPRFLAAARQTDWESKSGRVLRSLLRECAPNQDAVTRVRRDEIVDITGKADWTPPGGKWTILRIGHVNAKRVNAPAPKEATGWECDKLAPEGIEANFKGYIGMLLDGPLKGRMHAMLVDSWECFGQTWTPKMEQRFREANGYEVRTWLPALFGWVLDSTEATEAFLTDWRRTIGELVTKNYYGRMAELAHAAGLEVFYETAFGDIIHGDLLEYWKYSDAPMCEFWYPHAAKDEGTVGSYAFKPIRPCASAAHIYGKRRVVAEAFTGRGIHWDEDFRKLQDDANRHFARGVTHLALQSYTHAPRPDDLPPGGCMGGYNGTPFTRLQTWWKHMPAFTGWLARCEELLEEGQPAQDVLWYLGDAVDHKPDEDYPFPEGYRADYVNHDVLLNRLTVKSGMFTIHEGAEWKILWVPDTYRMLPSTKARINALIAAGGRVVIGGKDALVEALAELPKDVATDPALGDEPSEDFMWIHRRLEKGDRYFVAAGTNGWRGRVTFRAKGVASVFDPVSLERTAWRNGDVLEIPPSRSAFVEFSDAPRLCGAAPSMGSSVPLTNSWTLAFAPGWGAPEKVAIDRLVSWTEIPGFSREAQAYCGTVVYETTFDVAAPRVMTLDFGRVETIAKVFVNGEAVQTLWCEPYACDISRFARPGRNSLRIEVTSTWRNRVIYDLGQPAEKRKTWILYRKNYNPAPTDPLFPVGLLGPVILKIANF